LLSADVGNAFLRGLTFEELARITNTPQRRASFIPPKGHDSFIRELAGFEAFNSEEWELEMIRAIYGLKDAPRAWRITLHRVLLELGAKALSTDGAIYYWHHRGELCLLLSAHVDDLKITGEDTWISWLLQELTARFGELKVQWNEFEHCGLMYKQLDDFSVQICQDHYVLGLKPVDMTAVDCTKTDVALTKLQHSDYLSLLGGLSWLSQSRLDVAIYVQALQRAAKSPNIGNLLRLNLVTKWVRRKKSTLWYRQLKGILKILALSDAAFRREDRTGLAMKGSIVALCEQHLSHPGGLLQIIDFSSRRQRRIVRSTFGAELNSLIDCYETAKLLAITMSELLDATATIPRLREMEESGGFKLPIECVVDCKSIMDSLATDETRIPNEASLILLLLALKEALVNGTISALWWCDTADMAADGLNKGLVSRKALLELSATGLWTLKFPAKVHRELRGGRVD
jgi:hypothetical protein